MKSNGVFVSIFSAAVVFGTVVCGSGSQQPAPASNASSASSNAIKMQTPACGAGRALAQAAGDTRRAITSSRVEREYLLHVPASLPSGDGYALAPIPLLLVFHGAGTDAQFNADMTAIAASADR